MTKTVLTIIASMFVAISATAEDTVDFDKYDTNRDEHLSEDEWRDIEGGFDDRGVGFESIAAEFDEIDRNRDSYLSQSELIAHPDYVVRISADDSGGKVIFKQADQNLDKLLSPDEARQDEELTRYFVVWDADQNGQLDKDEIARGRQQQKGTANTASANGDTSDGLDNPLDDTPNVSIVDTHASAASDSGEAAEPRNVVQGQIAQDGTATPSAFQDSEQTRNDQDADASRRVQMMGDNLTERLDFSAYDTDGNGMLDRGEASDNAYVTANFDAWDTDGNDLLDPHEATQGRLDVDMN